MSLVLSTNNNEYVENVRTFLKNEVSAEFLRKKVAGQNNQNDLWDKLVEFGIFDLCALPESEFGLQNIAALIQEFGYYLVPEPCALQAVLGSYLFGMLISQTDKLALEKIGISLGDIQSGKSNLTSSFVYKNNFSKGSKNQCLFAPCLFVPCTLASRYLLMPTEAGPQIVDLQDPKVQTKTIQCIDISLNFKQFNVGTHTGVVLKSVDNLQIEQLKALIVANEIAGILKKVCDLTLDYVKTRKQFGVAVGSFQAVQHKLADMKVIADSLESLSLFAAWSINNSPEQASLALTSALKVAIDKGPEVIEQSIQAHGGIGFTWEYELHLYLRRVLLYKSLWSEYCQTDRLLSVAKLVAKL